MIEQERVSSMPQLRTYSITIPTEDTSEDTYVTRKVAQDLLDQAEEDLFCALGCLRRNPHEPLNEICYLLHQSLEKWIKVALQMSTGTFPHHHHLEKLLQPFCIEESENNKPELKDVFRILSAEPALMGNNYPDHVRYRVRENGERVYRTLSPHARLLVDAVFLTRRLVKRWLKYKDESGG